MTVELRVLGDVEAWIGDRRIETGHARQRCVLAVLLVEANRIVTVDQLLERVWPQHPPRTGGRALHTYLSRLRALLTPGGVAVERRPTGYVLLTEPAGVDLYRFRRLTASARAAADDHALGLYEQALALWRGEPFTGLETPWLAGVRCGLEQERVAAQLDYIDVASRCGRHAHLLPLLSALTDQDPLNERLAGQLMLALYRSGRQAESLHHYDRTRRRLAEELGTDPSHPLQQLHQQILTGDSSLVLPTGPPRSSNPALSPTPRQLPAAPRMFTGRMRELAELTETMAARAEGGNPMVISAIGGIGGIGKTWLALRWAHANAHRFPDGQFFINLRGFEPTGRPLDPAVALRGFLAALGVEPAAIPQELDAQTALYRSLIVDKRLLILLDNAVDSAQVTPLLPGSPTVAVVVTSRNTLPALITSHGARPLLLGLLAENEARQLLITHLGEDRVAAEPHAVADLLQHCAGFPLALGIIAARAAVDPALSLAALAGEIRDACTRLDALDTGELPANLRAVFSWSYRTLAADAARAFGLLGLAPGPDISLPAAASLTALPTPQARTLMRVLEAAHLIDQPVAGRYRMHDLVRLYATEQAHADQPGNVRDTALERLIDFYLHTAFAGDRLLDPHRPSIRLDQPRDCRPQPLADYAAALAWFDAEPPNLKAVHHLAAALGRHEAVWHLAWALTTFRHRRGHVHENLAACRAGLLAANHLADPATQQLARRQLGYACTRAGRHDEAQQHLRQALALATHTDDQLGQAHTHRILSAAWEQRGEDRRAMEHATHALRLYQTLDTPIWKGVALSQVGWYSARLGEHSRARASCEAALVLCRRHQHRDGEANTLDSLGYIAYETGQYTLAVGYYEQVLALRRDLGDAYEEADILNRLGHPRIACGQHEQARTAWQQALELYQSQHRLEDAVTVQQQLDALATY